MNSNLSGNKRDRERSTNSQNVLRVGSMPNQNQNNINNSSCVIPDNPRNSAATNQRSSNLRGHANERRAHQNYSNQIESGNYITGAMPYLPSNQDPDFNFPEVGKNLYLFSRCLRRVRP
jgi:hypothetical protein